MMHLIVMAKAPLPGRVKTRLCPPLQPAEAAELALASLLDTLDAVSASRAARRVLALDGPPGTWLPAGFDLVPQRGVGLGERLANAWTDVGPVYMRSIFYWRNFFLVHRVFHQITNHFQRAS